MKIVYVAFDGEEFETEQECLEHEKEQCSFSIDVPVCFDKNFVVLQPPPAENIDEDYGLLWQDFLNDAFYVVIRNPLEIGAIKKANYEFLSATCYETIMTEGIWKYDRVNDIFIDLEAMRNKLDTELIKIKNEASNIQGH